jgi:hypothetical protein
MITYDTLYKRNGLGKILFWEVRAYDDYYIIKHGLLYSAGHLEKHIPARNMSDEIKSRYNTKKKEGYKSIVELHDNAPVNLNEINIVNYLETYLPINNTSSNGAVLPMLCKTLEDNAPFDKLGSLLGQPKINGLRCLVGAEKTNDLFEPIKFTFQSREGTYWHLPNLQCFFQDNLDGELLDLMIEEGAKLDGEIYYPGLSVNLINSFVKNDSFEQHYKMQFWLYDIAVDEMSYINRHELLFANNLINSHAVTFKTKEDHLNNKGCLNVLTDTVVKNIVDATTFRDEFINLGFEGLVVRNPNASYGFDKRNSSLMLKYKKLYDGYFKIIDIVPEGKRTKLPKFVLQNDINSSLFECTSKGSFSEQEIILANKDTYIGKYAMVEFRERSGVNELPFHAKICLIKD